MDLEYIIGFNKDRITTLQSLNITAGKLYQYLQPILFITSKIRLTNEEFAQFLRRLKQIYDYNLNRPQEPDLVIYENSPSFPSKLAIEDMFLGITYMFRLVPAQGGVMKYEARYYCKECSEGKSIKRRKIVKHIVQIHNRQVGLRGRK